MQTCSVRINKDGQRIENLRTSWYLINRLYLNNEVRIKKLRNKWRRLNIGSDFKVLEKVEGRLYFHNRRHWELQKTREILLKTLKKEGIVV
jgi:alpha-glucuronidase